MLAFSTGGRSQWSGVRGEDGFGLVKLARGSAGRSEQRLGADAAQARMDNWPMLRSLNFRPLPDCFGIIPRATTVPGPIRGSQGEVNITGIVRRDHPMLLRPRCAPCGSVRARHPDLCSSCGLLGNNLPLKLGNHDLEIPDPSLKQSDPRLILTASLLTAHFAVGMWRPWQPCLRREAVSGALPGPCHIKEEPHQDHELAANYVSESQPKMIKVGVPISRPAPTIYDEVSVSTLETCCRKYRAQN